MSHRTKKHFFKIFIAPKKKSIYFKIISRLFKMARRDENWLRKDRRVDSLQLWCSEYVQNGPSDQGPSMFSYRFYNQMLLKQCPQAQTRTLISFLQLRRAWVFSWSITLQCPYHSLPSMSIEYHLDILFRYNLLVKAGGPSQDLPINSEIMRGLP